MVDRRFATGERWRPVRTTPAIDSPDGEPWKRENSGPSENGIVSLPAFSWTLDASAFDQTEHDSQRHATFIA